MNHQEASFLAHHGVKGMKWGVRKRQKIKKKALGKLDRQARYAKYQLDIYKQTKRSNDSHAIKETARMDHVKNYQNIKTSKLHLNKKIKEYSDIGKKIMAEKNSLMEIDINTISTRDYKRKVKRILD